MGKKEQYKGKKRILNRSVNLIFALYITIQINRNKLSKHFKSKILAERKFNFLSARIFDLITLHASDSQKYISGVN